MSKGKKIGGIIVDVFLYIFLAAVALPFLLCANGINDGVNKGWFGAEDMVYGLDAYWYNMLWAALLLAVIVPVVPAAAIYDIIVLIAKSVRKTLRPRQAVAIVLTLGLILVGAVNVLIYGG